MEDTEQCKLFIGGISWETTEDVLKEHFIKYGTVSGSVIAKNRDSGVPRGFAFVTFSESSAVERALMDTHQILNRTVEVKRAIPKNEQRNQQSFHRGLSRNHSRTYSKGNEQFRTKKIFVGGLSANLTEEEFRVYFEKFGRINDVVVMHDNVTHRPRGFGFITFDSEDSVEEVMQTNFHELSGKFVEVKRAVPKDGTSSTNDGYNGRINGGRSPNFTSHHQQVNYPAYGTRFGYFTNGYGNIPAYPYGQGIYNGGYPAGGYSGVGYGFPPVAQRSLWNPASVGIRGNFFTYGSAAPIYPTYVNGGAGVMPPHAANGYNGMLANGMLANGFDSKPRKLEAGDAQNPGRSTPARSGSTSEDTYCNGSSKGFRTGTSKQNQKGSEKAYETTNSS